MGPQLYTCTQSIKLLPLPRHISSKPLIIYLFRELQCRHGFDFKILWPLLILLGISLVINTVIGKGKTKGTWPMLELLLVENVGLVNCILRHINLCRLYNADSCFYILNVWFVNETFVDNNSFICTQLNGFKYCNLTLVILFNIHSLA